MQQYLYRIQPARADMLSSGPTPEEQRVVEEHFSYLQDLLNKGVVLTAGRTLTEDEHTFGIVLLEAESLACARLIMDNDPAVKEGVMLAELFPYRTALWSQTGPAAA